MADVLSRRLGHVACALEAVHHRHNVSAILRTCDALGVHGVHLVEGQRFRPSKGATRGAERWLDLQRHSSAADAIAALRDGGYRIYTADLSDDAVPPEEVPLDRPVCLWFGAEHHGVSAEATAAADGVVMLPMYGFAQSLNVSVATALVLQQVAARARARGDALLSEAEQQATLRRWVEREEIYVQGAQARQQLPRTLP
jgi:tRNA (guanosine-2'-O-)-methyltransferase